MWIKARQSEASTETILYSAHLVLLSCILINACSFLFFPQGFTPAPPPPWGQGSSGGNAPPTASWQQQQQPTPLFPTSHQDEPPPPPPPPPKEHGHSDGGWGEEDKRRGDEFRGMGGVGGFVVYVYRIAGNFQRVNFWG